MKLKILNISGTSVGEAELPVQFFEPLREDLIRKVVLAIQNNKKQAYGSYRRAGMRHSEELSKRRRKYRGSYGHGISRVPRKILSRRGTQMYWVGAVVPGTVGGRKAHPPKAGKLWAWKLNAKEKRKAIRSAMGAVMNKEMVAQRGHLVPENYPFLLDDSLGRISKTNDLVKALQKLGFKEELKRAEKSGTRAGRGKTRGRRKVVKKSVLLVFSDAKAVIKASDNIPGVDVVSIRRLNTEVLAPGGHPGRAAIFTTKAVEALKAGLFMKGYQGESRKKIKEKKVKKAKVKKGKRKKNKQKRATVRKVEVKEKENLSLARKAREGNEAKK